VTDEPNGGRWLRQHERSHSANAEADAKRKRDALNAGLKSIENRGKSKLSAALDEIDRIADQPTMKGDNDEVE